MERQVCGSKFNTAQQAYIPFSNLLKLQFRKAKNGEDVVLQKKSLFL